MNLWLADPPFFGGPGQGTRQIVELFVAFGLTALIGLEREIQGKSAGLRTQTIVGTAAALILLVSKYGFQDVLVDGLVVVDPSRVAAQIVSGIGFLGAGIIIFRRGSVHGLTTAAAVWESAAIGMAAGSGLLLLACTVTAMHFLIILGFMPLARRLSARLSGSIRMQVTYEEGRGVMSALLQACDRRNWQLAELESSLRPLCWPASTASARSVSSTTIPTDRGSPGTPRHHLWRRARPSPRTTIVRRSRRHGR
jgi:putative Mg2+ transporter-C (MgtC) family protein